MPEINGVVSPLALNDFNRLQTNPSAYLPVGKPIVFVKHKEIIHVLVDNSDGLYTGTSLRDRAVKHGQPENHH